ncbi:MAG: putative porin, partial [Deltaproteobacteria bacterium]|nr:putative porin [Deltaproteobacteria bacterium]
MRHKKILRPGPVLVAWLLMAAGWSGPVLADEPSTVEDVIVILRERGVIEEEDAARMVERNRAYENKKSWMDRLSFFGDFRARFDGEWFERDPLGEKHPERNRLRYRFRFGAKAEINDYFDLTFRLSSSCENRSGNQTLGRGLDCQEEDRSETDFGFDWDPDGIFINEAYIVFRPFGRRQIPYSGRKLDLMFGKMPNFFHSKVGKDFLVWDADLSPEGIGVSYGVDPMEGLGLTLNSAFLVIDENSSAADPYVAPVQLRLEVHPAEHFAFGTNLSYYGYGALDTAFYTRNAGRGNLVDAAGNFGLSSDRRLNVADLR